MEKKITNSIKVENYEVETPYGWVNIENIHETIPYQVYEIKLSDGKTLKCADNHIIIKDNEDECFVKHLVIGDKIIVENNMTASVVSLEKLNYKEKMYDLELAEDSKRVYFTNGILSHNTYVAKTLAEYLFSSNDSFIRIDMSEYEEKHSISKFIGSPPGYIGHEEKGQLTERIKNRPYSLILFDEIEKAHPDVFNVLLQILDDGKLTDSTGGEVNFKNTIIIMTSNIGTKNIIEEKRMGFNVKTDVVKNNEELVFKELEKHFRPEFLNRIDEKTVFNPLQKQQIKEIVELEINYVLDRIREKGYSVSVLKEVYEFIVEKGFDKKYGARPIKRAITKHIGDLIANAILQGDILEAQKIKLFVDKDKIGIKNAENKK